eukprot:IDg183t1
MERPRIQNSRSCANAARSSSTACTDYHALFTASVEHEYRTRICANPAQNSSIPLDMAGERDFTTCREHLHSDPTQPDVRSVCPLQITTAAPLKTVPSDPHMQNVAMQRCELQSLLGANLQCAHQAGTTSDKGCAIALYLYLYLYNFIVEIRTSVSSCILTAELSIVPSRKPQCSTLALTRAVGRSSFALFNLRGALLCE